MIAGDLVVNAVRLVRALRNISALRHSQASSYAAGSGRAKSEVPSTKERPEDRPPLLRERSSVPLVTNKNEASCELGDTEENEEKKDSYPTATPKSKALEPSSSATRPRELEDNRATRSRRNRSRHRRRRGGEDSKKTYRTGRKH